MADFDCKKAPDVQKYYGKIITLGFYACHKTIIQQIGAVKAATT